MIAADITFHWKQRYAQEVERSINYYNELNLRQPVHTRKMTQEEFEAAFGEKPESCHKLKINEPEVKQHDNN